MRIVILFGYVLFQRHHATHIACSCQEVVQFLLCQSNRNPKARTVSSSRGKMFWQCKSPRTYFFSPKHSKTLSKEALEPAFSVAGHGVLFLHHNNTPAFSVAGHGVLFLHHNNTPAFSVAGHGVLFLHHNNTLAFSVAGHGVLLLHHNNTLIPQKQLTMENHRAS